jgi:hypothetical protein
MDCAAKERVDRLGTRRWRLRMYRYATSEQSGSEWEVARPRRRIEWEGLERPCRLLAEGADGRDGAGAAGGAGRGRLGRHGGTHEGRL